MPCLEGRPFLSVICFPIAFLLIESVMPERFINSLLRQIPPHNSHTKMGCWMYRLSEPNRFVVPCPRPRSKALRTARNAAGIDSLPSCARSAGLLGLAHYAF